MTMSEKSGGNTSPAGEPRPDLETAARNLGRSIHGHVKSTLDPKARSFAAAVNPHLPDRAGMKKVFAWLLVLAVVMGVIGIAMG